MPKQDGMRLEGRVTEVLPNALFRIKLTNDLVILGHTSGKMRKNNIRILLGDRVDIEVSPYDLTKGRIVFRYRD